MATVELKIINATARPDTSGNVFFEPSGVKDTNDLHPRMVLVFKDTATRLVLNGSFKVPPNYVGNPKIKGRWKTSAITGSARWEFDYKAIANGESADPSANDESVAHRQAAPATAALYAEFEMALTAANLAVGDVVQFALVRDGAEASPNDDTIAADVVVEPSSVVFEYSDV